MAQLSRNLLAVFGVLAAPASAKLMRVSIAQVDSQPRVLDHDEVQMFSAAAIPGAQEQQEGGSTQDVVLRNFHNSAYYGEIQVGSPGQAVTVIFDTGSPDLWVGTAKVAGKGKASFEFSKSSSYTPLPHPFEIAYGSGAVRGTWCNDTVSIGDLSLPNFTLAEVNDTLGLRNWATMPFDGVLGLGFQYGDGPSLMGALVKSGQLEKPVFGFYLAKDAPGELVFGGVDPAHVAGNFTFVATLPQFLWWAVACDGVQLKGASTLPSKGMAIVDSGSSFLAGPAGEVKSLAKTIGAVERQGLYVISCSAKVPDLIFTLGGHDFALSFQDLVKSKVGDFCILGLQGITTPKPMWVLGSVFMRKFYVQFDWEKRRLGFALAATGANLV